jgi:hypothetical protein
MGILDKERIAKSCLCCGSTELIRSPAIIMPFVADRALNSPPVLIDESWGLTTIPKGSAYSLCHSLGCKKCGFIFLDLRFSDAEMTALYKDYRGEEYTTLREKYEPGYRARNVSLNNGVSFIKEVEDFLTPHLTFPAQILDWGGDTGVNSPFSSCRSLLHIYDISNKRVIEGAVAVDFDTVKKNSYSLLVCSQVLEHVPYPAEVLQSIAGVMNSDTVLYVELPVEKIILQDHDVGQTVLKKRHWHEHINFYAEDSLRSLLNLCGFEILDLKILGVPMNGEIVNIYQLAAKLL